MTKTYAAHSWKYKYTGRELIGPVKRAIAENLDASNVSTDSIEELARLEVMLAELLRHPDETFELLYDDVVELRLHDPEVTGVGEDKQNAWELLRRYAFLIGFIEDEQARACCLFIQELGDHAVKELHEFLKVQLLRYAAPAYHVKNIVWDTDGAVVDDLPSEVVIYGNPDQFADALSDNYSWCVNSLDVEEVPEDIPYDQLMQLRFLPRIGDDGSLL